MNASLKELLLSPLETEQLEGLRQITRDNFYVNLPMIMEIIRGKKGMPADEAMRIASSVIQETLRSMDNAIEPGTRDVLVGLLLKFEPEILERLRADFLSTDLKKRFDSLFLLRSMNSVRTASDILQQALNDSNKLIRAAAVKTLGTMARKKEPAIIVTYLKDADSRVRANAVEALEETENKNSVSVLLRIKNDTNNRVRANVVKALWSLGYHDVEKDLKEMVTSPSELMRASAAWVIGEIGIESQPLAQLLGRLDRDTSPLVSTNYYLARKKIADPSTRQKGKKRGSAGKGFKAAVVKTSQVGIEEKASKYFRILKLRGRLNAYSMIPVKLRIQEMLALGSQNIAFDFEGVDDIDATFMQFLKNLNKKIRGMSGKFMVFNTQKEVMDILSMNNVDGFVLIFSADEKVDHLL
ncbi:MAG: hypothetical protein A2268_16210 [Candidatus Raymondbacteria bacterium RifOxyA12_full_50_37]|uniref:STAS domain-containing protein n=1 Tax=Candidatus Raymondbacteria bacterium RIFOXYD12_FULL_49_13 TaxID=1817890 RepID=A0A1F7FC85_UNCRA|nr:MAG: hypothetical protein A2268_16210 [Candidatus Raymondbacteria bacterium RifOxyA12_full_50_37]OGJ94341.1 MAG: hypothetical protein A2248_14405 [Candidatus Raymondbacteria bacterium RIFOXYA2_FULL_49_16]OGJ95283.1 MAG: hypothetical protein A2453_05830 [Candidatus Raymondbacteria bacterium RIFOXYC2_FULL_50_21]OGK04122.1 MAG: hypothetical protein A2519_19680 [Candidatus Raymondbacteria bacterium RIFOXYD12_FULL_49_13]OGP39525.1 MAG: hypothetical protein A2324_11510 [Candidatus Raymondbacteria 